MSRVRYGDETHRAVRLQYEASSPEQRARLAKGWLLAPDTTADELIAEIKRSERIECPDCGASTGQLHQAGCDVEECATCGLQLISCEHTPAIYEVYWKDEDFIDGHAVGPCKVTDVAARDADPKFDKKFGTIPYGYKPEWSDDRGWMTEDQARAVAAEFGVELVTT